MVVISLLEKTPTSQMPTYGIETCMNDGFCHLHGNLKRTDFGFVQLGILLLHSVVGIHCAPFTLG